MDFSVSLIACIVFSIIHFTFFIYQIRYKHNKLTFSAIVCSIATIYYFIILGARSNLFPAAMALLTATFLMGNLTAWLINKMQNNEKE